MIRKIIKIDEERCNGCGACAVACHEGAIEIVNGKAKLKREDYCDGLGDCLPACPTNAISIEEREALSYDEESVIAAKLCSVPTGCISTHHKTIQRKENVIKAPSFSSMLNQWPIQIKLAPVNAEFFNNVDLLIAADCTAYAYGNFHNDFMRNHITLIGCPKLDNTDYSEKLTEIISKNNVKSITVVKMKVPCCKGIENAVKNAIFKSGKFIPTRVITISTDGKISE